VTTHEHAFVLAAPNRVTRTPPQRSPDPEKTPPNARKTAQREGNGAEAPLGTPRPTVNAGSDSNAPTTPYGRVPAMIIRMRLRAGAAIPGRLSTHPLCAPIAGNGGSMRSPQPGRRSARDFHPPLRRPKALLRAEPRSRVTYDHPRSPTNKVAARCLGGLSLRRRSAAVADGWRRCRWRSPRSMATTRRQAGKSGRG